MSNIIGTLPANLQNGTNADASQVMADLNFIVNQVNANAQPAGTYLQPGFISPGALVGVQVIAATGAYTATSGATKGLIEMCGGGGAGGGAVGIGSSGQSGGSGGAAGNFLRLWIPSGLQSYSGTTVTIGAGGVGSAGANGGAGGNTTFGSVATAYGGQGGVAGPNYTGPIGGAASSWLLACGAVNTQGPTSSLTRLVAFIGAAGGDAIGGNSAVSLVRGGDGGGAPLGSGGYGARAGLQSASATAGSGYGAAGGGAALFNTASSAIAGQPGSAGVWIIYEFE